MRPKYLVPYGVPLLMLGLYGYTIRQILMSDPDGIRTVSGIIVLSMFSLVGLGCLTWIVMTFKQNRQSKRILFGTYPELKGLKRCKIPFAYQNDLWELYIYKDHLISRRNDFTVINIRDIDQMVFTYRTETYNDSRQKVYQLIVQSNDPISQKKRTFSLRLQSGDFTDVKKMMTDLFDYISEHYPEIILKDQRFEGQRTRDCLKKPWSEGHWVSTGLVLVSILPLYSAIKRGEWGSNDKITIVVFGVFSLTGAYLSFRKILSQRRQRQILTNQYPELETANLAQVCDYTILDLRIYLYGHYFFQQKGKAKIVDLHRVSVVRYQVTDVGKKHHSMLSHHFIFADENGCVTKFHLQTTTSSFIYEDKVDELFAYLNRYFPNINLEKDLNL